MLKEHDLNSRSASMDGWVRFYPRSASTIVFGISFLILFVCMDGRLSMFDEGIVLVNAMRTLDGDVIHRDYYSCYGPASYYLVAGLFLLDEHRFILGRIFGIAVMAGITTATFALLLPLTRLWIGTAFTAICGAWMLGSPSYLYPTFPCLVLMLIGSMLLLGWSGGRPVLQLFLAGCATGATALFRYDYGFFLLMTHIAAIAIIPRLGSSAAIVPYRVFIRAVVIYGSGTALVFGPWALWFLSVAPVSAFVADIIDYPLRYYSAMRGLPFPTPLELLRDPSKLSIYVPVLAVIAGSAELMRRRRTRVIDTDASNWPSQHSTNCLIVFVLLALMFYYMGSVRAEPLHMLVSTVPAGIALALVVNETRAGAGTRRVAVFAFLLAVTSASYAASREVNRTLIVDATSPLARTAASAGVTGRREWQDQRCAAPVHMTLALQRPAYARVSEYLRRYTDPEDRIFVALRRHDKIFANAVALYFSADRLPATHWHQFDPGLQSRADIQQQIVAELSRNEVRWVVRDASFEGTQEPNMSSVSSGVFILDSYLAANYRPVARDGPVEIWLANGWAPPPVASPAACLPAGMQGPDDNQQVAHQ